MASTFTPSGAHAAMTCPKCTGEMRAYERSGVIVDACRECRGIFLDRGELEHLVDLEAVASDREDRRPGRDDRAAARREDHRREDLGRDERWRSGDRDDRPGRYGDRRESPVDAFGDAGELGGLGEIGELLGSRDRSRPAPDPRSGSSYAPKKRSSFFRDLLEGFGE